MSNRMGTTGKSSAYTDSELLPKWPWLLEYSRTQPGNGIQSWKTVLNGVHQVSEQIHLLMGLGILSRTAE